MVRILHTLVALLLLSGLALPALCGASVVCASGTPASASDCHNQGTTLSSPCCCSAELLADTVVVTERAEATVPGIGVAAYGPANGADTYSTQRAFPIDHPPPGGRDRQSLLCVYLR